MLHDIMSIRGRESESLASSPIVILELPAIYTHPGQDTKVEFTCQYNLGIL